MRNKALKNMIMSKTNNKLSYQTNGILFYIIFTFDRVAQNATNYGSNYEYLKNEGLDI